MTDKPFTERPVLGRWTQNYAAEKGVWGAAKKSMGQGFEDIGKGWKVWDAASKGNRAVAFGRVTGVGAGLAITADAVFRGQTADGEDRGFLGRLFEAVMGLGVAAGSLIVGKGR